MTVHPAPLARRLASLRTQMQHLTDYDASLPYFFTEVAADPEFEQLGRSEDSPALRAMFGAILTRLLGAGTTLRGLVVVHVAAHELDHGCGVAAGRAMAFCFCRRLNLGIMGLTPGLTGPTEVVRFRLARVADLGAVN